MAVIVLPQRWLAAPEYPVEIDWSNPLSQGLVFATPLSIPGWGRWYDPIQHKFATAVASNLPTDGFNTLMGGRAANFASASSQGLKIAVAPVTALPITLSALYKQEIGGNYRTIMSYGGQSTNQARVALTESTAPAVLTATAVNSAATGSSSTVAISGAGKVVHVAGVFRSSTYRRVFMAGVGASSDVVSVAFDGTAEGIAYGSRYTTSWGSYCNTQIQIPKMWARELSPSEILEDSRNPWQVFKPLVRRIWVPSSAVGPTYTIDADPGAFSVVGTDATLTYNRVLVADSGAFALTGTDATLTYNRVLVADSGAFALTGTDATLTYTPASGATYTLNAESGTFAVTGTDATLALGRVLETSSGSFALTGTDATLTYSPVGGLTLTAGDLAAIDDLIVARLPDIAAAILLAAQVAPIHSRVKIIHNTTLDGTGTASDPMRPA